MKKAIYLSISICLLSLPLLANDVQWDENLKDSYIIERTPLEKRDRSLVKTKDSDSASSYICRMFKSGVSPGRGLKLELRAKAVVFHYNEKSSLGFIVITREGEVLQQLKPLTTNYYKHPLLEWKSEAVKNIIYTGRPTEDETVEFDAVSGLGSLERHDDYLKENAYQLADCNRIIKYDLPVYVDSQDG